MLVDSDCVRHIFIKLRVAAFSVLLIGHSSNSACPQAVAAASTDIQSKARVDALFGSLNSSTPGCAVGVVRNGNLIYSRAYGMASLELNVPMSTDLVFPVNSISKQFTAMAVVLLASQNRLSLSDDIHKYVPELPAYAYPVTIEELLHQSSGLKDYDVLLTVAGAEPEYHETNEMVLNILRRQKELNAVPGSQYMYSNTNYFLLGLVAERISAESLPLFAQKEIFGRLEMNHSKYHEDDKLIAGQVSTYLKTPHEILKVDDHRDVIGAAGVYTTIEDLAKWDRNFYDGGVGGQKSIELMLHQEPLLNGSLNMYSAGLENTTYRGLKVVEHAGDGYGSQSNIMRFPDQKFTSVVLCNVRNMMHPAELTRRIADIYLDKQMHMETAPRMAQTEPARRSEAAPIGVVGLYWDGRTEGVYRVAAKDGLLTILELPLYPDFPAVNLTYLGDRRFKDTNQVYRLQDAAVTEAQSTEADPHTLALFRVQEPDTSPKALDSLTGTFYSSDLDVTWRFAVQQGRLVLQRSGFPDEILNPAFGDAFFCDAAIGIVHFTRDKAASVNGFDALNHRLVRARFDKQP